VTFRQNCNEQTDSATSGNSLRRGERDFWAIFIRRAFAARSASKDEEMENRVTKKTDEERLAAKAPESGVQTVKPIQSRPPGIAASLLQLQQTRGNRYTQQLLRSRVIQAKLAVSQPDDKYEREADDIADRVMRLPEGEIEAAGRDGDIKPQQGSSISSHEQGVQRNISSRRMVSRADADEVEADYTTARVMLGRKASVGAMPSALIRRRSPGQPLDFDTRAFMEPRFGYDFSQVRVHLNDQAAESARALNAQAYTVGQDIVFAAGQYAPHSREGRKLLAHELAHTIQSNINPQMAGHLETTTGNESAEQEAHQASEAVGTGQTFAVTPNSLSKIGRQTSPDLKKLLEDMRRDFQEEAYFELLSKIGTPQLYMKRLIDIINYLPADDLEKAVILVGQGTLESIAGSTPGKHVVTQLQSKLSKGAALTIVDQALNSRSSSPTAIPVAKATPDDQKAIDRINRVLAADPKYGEYTKNGGSGPSVPLRFPVEIYSAGRAVDGGVYYDPNMKNAGLTPVLGTSFSTKAGGKTPVQYPLAYIKLGPDAVKSSDSYLQSLMWHEFEHYKRLLSFRQPAAEKGKDVKLLEGEVQLMAPGSEIPSMEVEATSIQLANYFDNLPDTDAKSVLLYLSRFLNTALPDFKNAAIDRITKQVAGNAEKKKRMLKVIDSIKDEMKQKGLKDLREALVKTK
jgi:hypothetical protein